MNKVKIHNKDCKNLNHVMDHLLMQKKARSIYELFNL